MKTIVSILLAFVALISALQKKNDTSFSQQMSCATDEILQKALIDTLFRLRHETYEAEIYKSHRENSLRGKSMQPPFILPVVVHLVHNNGPEDISDAIILQGIAHLNEAYANMGYYDQNLGDNTQIQFCLATRDP